MPDFELVADYTPMGDQPKAIAGILEGIEQGHTHQTLLGATGTGKTFTIANVVEQLNRPTLVLAHNKTLAAQLYSEFRSFFPNNAVEYFVSYYDYYQPEAYVPRHDLFIEKETSINEEIDRLRIASTAALLSRRDVLIVASVSCIYGLGRPQTWREATINLSVGETIRRDSLLRDLVHIRYNRKDMELNYGTFRVRGDTLELMPGFQDIVYRISFWGDEIERITEVDPITGELLNVHDEISIFPTKHYITTVNTLEDSLRDIEDELEARLKYYRDNNRLLEAQRLEQRTNYDLEMLREVGTCSGIENYSRHLDRRQPGEPPYTLIDYFPDDYLIVVDESHMTIPQVRGMFNGDRARKDVLIEHGFRLTSARDNRPLTFDEFQERINQMVHMSATPGPYEYEHSGKIIEQLIRPTGLIDPPIEVRPVEGQIDDLLGEIQNRVARGQRALVTTLTKRMSEKLTDYFREAGVKVQYLHSDIQTIERVEILRDLRRGVYDVCVGVNLLREGLDLPEVSLVAILDADKAGFLRSATALIQTIGRAARHVEGQVIMYALNVSEAMQEAIDETNRRREKQIAHNKAHNIEPAGIIKEIRDLTERVKTEAKKAAAEETGIAAPQDIPTDELEHIISELEDQMRTAAADLEFERAALIRDQVKELRETLLTRQAGRKLPIWEQDRLMPVEDVIPE